MLAQSDPFKRRTLFFQTKFLLHMDNRREKCFVKFSLDLDSNRHRRRRHPHPPHLLLLHPLVLPLRCVSSDEFV